jgi:ribonuclease BN (tRNA processing enzyme)
MLYHRREFIRQSILFSGALSINIPSAMTSDRGMITTDRLVLLGTQGGPLMRSYKQTPAANLIVYKNTAIVVDTGFGVTFKLLDAGINLASIKYIFITHHHSDHNLELGPVLYNAWIAGLNETLHVYAPIGLNALLASYWESNRFDIETRIKDEGRPDIRSLVISHEYTEGSIVSNSDFEVTALKNIHPPIIESYSLKFKLGDKIVVFSGDTNYFSPLASLASNAVYLVHEVMYGPAIDEMLKNRPKNAAKLKASILSHHTLAEDVGKIATQANAKTLVLTHFVPADKKLVTKQQWIDAVRKTFSGKIIVGEDLLELPL